MARAATEVTLAVRNGEAGGRAAQDIAASTGSDRLRVALLDLDDQVSVAAFVAGWSGPLHLLVNNAGLVTGGLARNLLAARERRQPAHGGPLTRAMWAFRARTATAAAERSISAVAPGAAVLVTEAAEKAAALIALVEAVAPGRSAGTRAPSAKELAATAVLRLDLGEVSPKVRTGGPNDDPEDRDLPHWAGVLPPWASPPATPTLPLIFR